MLTLDEFDVASGTVIGRDHVLLGQNNQDACSWWKGPEGLFAVVCDGCGSGRASEVGAALGARLAVEALRREVQRFGAESTSAVLESVRLHLLAQLRHIAVTVGGPRAKAVSDYLLFTIVGTVLTESLTCVFTLGDGVLAINGAPEVLACPDNAPPYLAYGLTNSSLAANAAGSLRFELRHALPTAEVSSVLIGTDGVAHLLAAGPADWLWEDVRHFRNPAGLTRRLRQLNRASQRIDWERRRVQRERALLVDDTTLVVIRRRRAGA